jgi:hypothetical protein
MNEWELHILSAVRGRRPIFLHGQEKYDILSENGTKLEVKGSKYDINNPNSVSSEWVWNVNKVPCDRYILVGQYHKRTRSGFKDCYCYFDVPAGEMEPFLVRPTSRHAATERKGPTRVRCVPVTDDMLIAMKEPGCWSTQRTGNFVLRFITDLAEIRRRYRRVEPSR